MSAITESAAMATAREELRERLFGRRYPSRFGPYRIRGLVARRPSGVVLMADHVDGGGSVHLELVDAGAAVRACTLQRARTARCIQHRHLQAVIAAGLRGRWAWVATAPTSRCPAALHEAEQLEQIASAVAAAHAAGLPLGFDPRQLRVDDHGNVLVAIDFAATGASLRGDLDALRGFLRPAPRGSVQRRRIVIAVACLAASASAFVAAYQLGRLV